MMVRGYKVIFCCMIYAMTGCTFSQGNGYENVAHRCTMFSPICWPIRASSSNMQPVPQQFPNIDSRNWEYPDPQKPVAENRPYNSAIDENAKNTNTDQNYKSVSRYEPNFPRGPQFYPYFPSGSMTNTNNEKESKINGSKIERSDENGKIDPNSATESLKNMNQTVKTEINETAVAEGDSKQISGKVSNINQNLTNYSNNMSNWSGNATRWSNNYSKSVRTDYQSGQPSSDPVRDSNKMMAAGKKEFEEGV